MSKVDSNNFTAVYDIGVRNILMKIEFSAYEGNNFALDASFCIPSAYEKE